MKIKYFAEIGLNYLAKSIYLKEYLNKLCSSKIDGVTIQILNDDFYVNEFKNYKLPNTELKNFIHELKKNKKYVGIVTNDYKKVEFFNKMKIDFYKVLSSNLNDEILIKKLLDTNSKKVFISTGLSNYKNIENILKKIKKNKKKICLIHTSFKKEKKYINLNRVKILKKKFKFPICYGNHSKYLNSIIDVKKFDPYAIFFYVKLNKKLNYPDNIHAIKLKNINKYIN